MVVNSALRASLALIAGCCFAAEQPAIVTEEVPIGFLPVEWVTAALKKTLSAQGRTVFVHAGPVRISDEAERVAAARRAIEELQRAPAVVPMELAFVTMARRTVQRLPVQPPVVDRGIPVPNRYDPPRVIVHGNGGVTVIPSQPRDFTTRSTGSGAVVNPSTTGFATLDPEVRMSETTTTSSITRRFTASSVPGRPVAVTVLPQADAAALRALALKLGAIGENEPAWPAARTELLLQPELSGGALAVNVTPQIVLPPARRIPLPACAAAVLIARGAASSTGLLPRTDPEFYRTFLGAPQVGDDTTTALTVKAQVQYLGSPPR